MANKIIWTNERRKLSDLIPWPRNPRQIKGDQAKRLVQSFDEFGQVETIAIGPGNEVYNGHQRLNVLAQQYGKDYDVEVRVSSRALEEKEREKLTIFLHKGAAGEWDFDTLANEFELDDLLEWGFDKKELDIDLWAGSDLVLRGEAVYSEEQIIDAAFNYFRSSGFPYRNLPIHICMQEINKLASDTDNLMASNYASTIADTYNKHRFHASADGMKSPYDAFMNDKDLRKAIKLAYESSGKINDGMWGALNLVNGTQACSNFRPGFACYLYRKYCLPSATVLDTSTGYGGRLVGAIASGVVSLYIGIDPNKPTHDGNARMAHDLGFSDKIELYNLPAEDVDAELLFNRCDFAFTSPPYFSKEHYSDDDTQSWVRYKTGNEWKDGFLYKMLLLQFAALKEGANSLINIADVKIKNKVYPLVNWTIELGKEIGFEHIETNKYELKRRFGAGMDDEIATEPVIVFRKPEA